MSLYHSSWGLGFLSLNHLLYLLSLLRDLEDTIGRLIFLNSDNFLSWLMRVNFGSGFLLMLFVKLAACLLLLFFYLFGFLLNVNFFTYILFSHFVFLSFLIWVKLNIINYPVLNFLRHELSNFLRRNWSFSDEFWW